LTEKPFGFEDVAGYILNTAAGGLLKVVNIEDIGKMKRDFYVVNSKKLSLSPTAEAFLKFAMPAVDAGNNVELDGIQRHHQVK
jgi:hypothetical protein